MPPQTPVRDFPAQRQQRPAPTRNPWDDVVSLLEAQSAPKTAAIPDLPVGQPERDNSIGTGLRSFGDEVAQGLIGIPKAIMHPIDTVSGMIDAGKQEWKQAGETWDRGSLFPVGSTAWIADKMEGAGGYAAALMPGVGPRAAEVGRMIGRGDVSEGLGRSAGLIALTAAPGKVGKEITGKLKGGVGDAMARGGNKLAQDVLKTPAEVARLAPGGASEVAATALREKVLPGLRHGRSVNRATGAMDTQIGNARASLAPTDSVPLSRTQRGPATQQVWDKQVYGGQVAQGVDQARAQLAPLTDNPRLQTVPTNAPKPTHAASSSVLDLTEGTRQSVRGQSGVGPSMARGRGMDLRSLIAQNAPQAATALDRANALSLVEEALARPGLEAAIIEGKGIGNMAARIAASVLNRAAPIAAHTLDKAGRGLNAATNAAKGAAPSLLRRNVTPSSIFRDVGLMSSHTRNEGR